MQQNVPKLWLFFFLLIVFLVIGLAVTAPKAPADTQDESDATDVVSDEVMRSQTFEDMLALGEDAIYVENQTSGERQISVGYVVLSQPGFIAVYNDANGVPGDVIGESGLLQDGGEHVTVRLEESLEEHGVYYAVLYRDDGDGEFYEMHDAQVIDSEGSVVLMSFEALENASPETGAILP